MIEMTKRMEIQKQNSTEQEKLSSLSSRSNEVTWFHFLIKLERMAASSYAHLYPYYFLRRNMIEQ